MQDDLTSRALGALHEYFVYLRDRRGRTEARRAPEPADAEARYRAKAERRKVWGTARGLAGNTYGDLDRWERRKAKAWARDGRLGPGGRLLVPDRPAEPWTLGAIAASFPHLTRAELIGAALWAGAVLSVAELEELREQLTEVVEAIVDVRLSLIFGHMRAAVRRPGYGQVEIHHSGQGGKVTVKKNRCGNCQEPGHRATTCTNKKDPIDAAREAERATA